MLLAQVVPICVPDLELVRVAQILTISSEMCQAYKFAMADSRLRKQFNLETRVSLAAAARFTATDYLQVMSSLGGSWLPLEGPAVAASVWHVSLPKASERVADGQPRKLHAWQGRSI